MKNKTRRRNSLIWIGIVICACIMGYSGYQVYFQTKDDVAGKEAYSQLKSSVVSNSSSESINTETQTSIDPRADIASLKTITEDAVGWIYSPGTAIDYPVVQGTDNSYYLSHLYDGSAGSVGAIFMDYRNAADFSDRNSVLYGHHMKSGQMFASINGYKDQSYYDEHPVLELDTEKAVYRLEAVAGYVVSGASNNLLDINGKSDEEFLNFIADVRAKSTFESQVTVNGQDRVVSLATCAYDFSNARYVLICKITEY